MSWTRVRHDNRCPICGHDSWCVYNREVVLCMRVESERPKVLKSGETGYLHDSGFTSRQVRHLSRPVTTINAAALILGWQKQTTHEWLEVAARELGVSCASLERLRACHAPEYAAMAFPMYNGVGAIVGVRLRSRDGSKFAVTGSHQGIFLPQMMQFSTVYILEGPTDTAAALTLGCFAIGRPSCSGGMTEIVQAVSRYGLMRAVIIADNDEPGIRGAKNLSEVLTIPSCVVVLPCKDLREFIRSGGDRETLDCLVNGSIWTKR